MPVVTGLHLYPIKSCAGIALREATVTPAGLMSEFIYDREWMVVDLEGNFLTQRDYPQMATIVPRLRVDTLEVRAPGMLRLDIPLDLPDPEHAAVKMVQVWDDQVMAYDCDETTATWFSRFLGIPCRLVRFHPEAKRQADAIPAQGTEATTLFADGFPLLVLSHASLDDFNQKWQAAGHPALPMDRFRPNIVIDGIGAFEEDFARTITVGAAILQPVKPCPRCRIISVDQATGQIGPSPLDILQTYRAEPKIDGGLAFGMNAILLQGANQVVRVGQEASLELAF